MAVSATLVITALILVNAIYVAAEFSAVSVRRSRIQKLAEDGNRLAAWLLPILESPARLDRYIAVCQIGITLSSLGLGAFAQRTVAVWLTPLFASWGGMQDVAAISASSAFVLIVLTILQVLLGELMPKSLALQYPTPTALYSVVPMVPSAWLLRPFNAFLNGSGLLLLRLLGAPHPSHRHIHSPEEIELLIAESRDGGLLEPDEHRRLRRALRLNLTQARQLMRPRPKIAALEISTPLNEVVDIVTRSPFSRLPVYRGSIDNVVGVLHTKDLARWLVSGTGSGTLASLVRPIATVPESVTVDRVLQELRDRGAHQALVVDEHGGTAGLVTLEDVLSELLGDVGDEFRAAEPAPEVLPDGRIRLPGSMSVDEASVLLDTRWDTDAATIGGVVIERLGHLPSAGERTEAADVEFTVERVSGHAIESIIARRRPERPEASA